MNLTNLMKLLKPYTWRLVCSLLGLIAAISFLVLGFGKTILILLCCGVGYLIGVFHDKNIHFLEWLQYWRDKMK